MTMAAAVTPQRLLLLRFRTAAAAPGIFFFTRSLSSSGSRLTRPLIPSYSPAVISSSIRGGGGGGSRLQYSTLPPPPPKGPGNHPRNNNAVKFWPFFAIIVLGTGAYVLMVRKRAERGHAPVRRNQFGGRET
ncbi:hypothetical protein F4778DRAFT_715735 [Xylariomycetidae sp. FL2044]|nr:hypothetical protein F4778DRAFT_715735 [Xylariomycetidae sp. FL2044]